MAGAVPLGCGQCLPCRINRRRQWMWRQYLEALTHEENCFVTLTYDDDHLPRGNTLVPQHLQLFLKRLRKAAEPTRIRFFASGEYGEGGLRFINPHYHVSLFGMSGRTDDLGRGRLRHHGGARLIQAAWGLGAAYTAEFNEKTAQYVAGYVVKKLTAKDDPRLAGRHPEFARMSNRPGIGAGAAELIAKRLSETYLDWADGDCPKELRIGSRKIPLGRYMLRKLRLALGFSEKYIKEMGDQKSYERSLELLALFQTDENSALTAKEAFLTSIQQKIRNTEARALLWKKRNTI